MKKILLTILISVAMVGCGQNQSAKEQKYQGVQEQKDYIAEGVKYLEQADIPSAIRSFDEAIKQDPTNVENYITLGEVYLRLNNFDRAVDSFSAATRVEPQNAEVRYLLATSKAFKAARETDQAQADLVRGDAINEAQKSAEMFLL